MGYNKYMSVFPEELKELELKANEIRQTIVRMLAKAQSGHTAGPLGMADMFAALYFKILKQDPKNPDWPDRDRLILSNGHTVPVRYAAMALAGYFPVEETLTLRQFHSRLQGHPERHALPGLETTSGPLGSGLSEAAGIAYGARMDGKQFRTYCMTSDGEHEEGNTWEAILFAGKARLANLTVFIDRNDIQIDGTTTDVLPLSSMEQKYQAFNWHVIPIDGNDIGQILTACDEAAQVTNMPTVIIAHTIAGKGVPEIEGDYRWHGVPPGKGPTDKIPADKQEEVFLQRLSETRERILAMQHSNP